MQIVTVFRQREDGVADDLARTVEGDVTPTSDFHDRNVEWVEDIGLGSAGGHRVDRVVLNGK